MDAQDRLDTNTLHAVASGSGRMPTKQFRDASRAGNGTRASGTSGPHWVMTPTYISTPSNQMPKTSGMQVGRNGQNPYTMKHLNGKKEPNLFSPAHRTVLNVPNTRFGRDPPTKRLSSHTADSAERYETSRYFPVKDKGKGKQPETIIIDGDEDEDIGAPVSRSSHLVESSPDPLNTLDVQPSHSGRQSCRIERFQSGVVNVDATEHPRHAVPDGENTQVMRKQLGISQDHISDDSIQNADDQIWEGGLAKGRSKKLGLDAIQPGYVTERSRVFQKNGTPHINLASRQVKNAMKPKSTSTKAANSKVTVTAGQKDPVATSTSKYTFSQPLDIVLPIEEFAYGMETYPTSGDEDSSPFMLHYARNTGKLMIMRGSTRDPSASYAKEIALEEHVKAMKFSLVPSEPIIIQMEFYKPKDGDTEKLSTPHFKPGSRGQDGLVTLKLCQKAPLWNVKHYESFSMAVKQYGLDRNVIDEHATKTIWTDILHGLEVKHRKEQRESRDEHDEPTVKERSRLLLAQRDRTSQASRSTRTALPLKSNPITSTSRQRIEPPQRPRPRPVVNSTESSPSPSPSVRRSARQQEIQSRTASVDLDELILVYPSTGTGAVNITRGDLNRLEPGEFLNDTLIEFGLKLWLQDIRDKDKELADQIHVFSSFFYKKLYVKNLEEGYQSVRKWTSKFDFFQKKYIIVPINENFHWYLAIICYPEHVLSSPPQSSPPASSASKRRKLASDTINAAGPVSAAADAASTTTTSTCAGSPQPLDMSILADEEKMETSTKEGSPSALSEAQGEREVERLLGSCSLTNGKAASSSALVEKFSHAEPIDVDTSDISVDVITAELSDDDDQLRLVYPSSDDGRMDHMDVDMPPKAPEPVDQAEERSNPTTETILSGSPTASQTAELPELKDEGPAVQVTNFYGSASNRGKRKREEPVEVDVNGNTDNVSGVNETTAGEDEVPADGTSKTHIFILDSLGTKHPQAIRTLKTYLQMEAMDKKKVPVTGQALGRNANVPTQPNFCDCGIYLLHFARNFMETPEYYVELTTKRKLTKAQRGQEWRGEDVGDFRSMLSERIKGMSNMWKIERQKKLDAEATTSRNGVKDAKEGESSDDDIVIEEGGKTTVETPKEQGKEKAKSKAVRQEAPASRIRG